MLRERNEDEDMLRKDNKTPGEFSPELLLWLARACERRLSRSQTSRGAPFESAQPSNGGGE